MTNLNNSLEELNINPVYTFENLELESTKQNIQKSTSNLNGIYMIFNKITKDYYIGSASNNKFYAKFSNHLIYFKGSKIIKAAVKKYGLDNFAFLVLELYPDVITKENNKELIDLEDKYLKLLLPNYNIVTEAGSNFGYKHTEIDRINISNIYIDKLQEKVGNLTKNKLLSLEEVKPLKSLPVFDQSKLKCISDTRPVILYNLNDTIYGKYTTIKNAAEAINSNVKTLNRALKTEKRLVKRQWKIKYWLK